MNMETILRSKHGTSKNYEKQKKWREGKSKMLYEKKKEWLKKTLVDNPWIKAWLSVTKRCRWHPHYVKKGVKCLITKPEIAYLWERDGASNLKNPQIDRIDNSGDYTLLNCHFIEKVDNIRKAVRLNGRWSTLGYDKCVVCGTTKIRHYVRGKCKNCYQRGYAKEIRRRIK